MSSLWSWIKTTVTNIWNSLTSSEVNSGLVLLAQGAGVGVGALIVNTVDKNNKSGTASDVASIGNAVLSILTGSIPTSAQITTIMTSMKANAKTTNYGLIAQQFITAFEEQLTAWAAAGYTAKAVTAYAKAFVNGLISGASNAA